MLNQQHIVQLIAEAMDRPLIAPGSNALAAAVLKSFPDPMELFVGFAGKVKETLEDDTRHNRVAIQPGTPPVAISFNAWPGSHMEVLPERYGTYLEDCLGLAMRLVDRAGPLGAFLQIDSFPRMEPDEAGGERLAIDVEFTYLPGGILRMKEPDGQEAYPKALMLNTDLCSEEERQLLERLIS
jgi:hypothetical protein